MNRKWVHVTVLLATALLVACTNSPETPSLTATSQPFATPTLIAPSELRATPTFTVPAETPNTAEIRSVVDDFGKQLQLVSLLAPDAAQQIEAHYAAYVSPALLKTWMIDSAHAPGRTVSSPWPDRIEITDMTLDESGRYTVTGFVIEMTSQGVAAGSGEAAKIPVHLLVQKSEGQWRITEYAEEP